MKFKKILFYSALGSAISFNTYANQLNITGNQNINIPGSVGNDFSNNAGDSGIIASGSGNEGTLNVTGDLKANDNAIYGITSNNSGKININGNSSNNSLLQANNNKDTITAWGLGIYSTDQNSEINIKNMNIEANGNNHGVYSNSEGKITLTGDASGINWLHTNNNKTNSGNGGVGIHSNDTNSKTNIENMNIEANGNVHGISANKGEINLIGVADGTNLLQANNNKNIAETNGIGIHSTDINSEINIKNMNIETNNNIYGLYSLNTGKINIEGIASGANWIKANNNRNGTGTEGIGIYTNQNNSKVDIKNMNIEANGNVHGISASKGEINLTGVANGTNWLQANNNKDTAGTSGVGIYSINNNSKINIKDMNIEANGNVIGIYSRLGGEINITGINDGTNWLHANNNRSNSAAGAMGIYSNDANSKINIKNMNIEGNGNVFGIYSNFGSKINIEGIADGTNWIQTNNNINDAGASGVGILSNNSNSEIDIKNMNIQSNDNIKGISASNDGKINIEGISSGKNWVQANGNLQYGLSTSNSEINIKDSNAMFNNNHINGINNSGTVNIEGVNSTINIEVSNNHVNGISNASNSILNIKNANITLKNNNGHAIYAGTNSTLNISGGANNNLMIVKDNNDLYSIATTGAGSKINITNMDMIVSRNDLFLANNGGAIELNNTNLLIADNSSLLNSISGVGNFTATNSSLMNNIFTDTGAGATSNISLNNTSWKNIGKSNITNYTANNVDIYMNNYFGAGNTGDLLTIENSSTGNTTLHVNSTGTDGSEAEIKLVDQSLVSSPNANGVFVLDGGVVDSGAYEYDLQKGDLAANVANSNNYYLRSNGRMTTIAKTIANLPAIHINIIKTGMNELRKRMGELRDNDPEHKSGVWARSYAKNMKITESIDSNMNIYGFEAGFDKKVYSDCLNKVYTGIMAGYLYTDNIHTKNNRTSKGSGQANTPTIGAYASWINKSGFFVDATIRQFWSNMNMKNTTASNNIIKFEADRQFTAGSLELGQQFEIVVDEASKYVLEPKVEMIYAYSGKKNFRTRGAVNNRLYYSSTDSFQTRGSLMLGYNKKLDNGSIIEPFLEFGVNEEWGGINHIRYAGANYKSDVSGTSFDFGAGLNAKINNNLSLFGDVVFEKGSVVEAVSTNLGLRYNF